MFNYSKEQRGNRFFDPGYMKTYSKLHINLSYIISCRVKVSTSIFSWLFPHMGLYLHVVEGCCGFFVLAVAHPCYQCLHLISGIPLNRKRNIYFSVDYNSLYLRVTSLAFSNDL